ncbi:histidine kinase [Rhizobium sp. TRM95796]|uniref:sensor histidine kinase n=1 Tax=Rhizobium sp. TRM95796 TaxID=2979862 RepID=UPI0021E99CF1|nr:histidine kinase [Rhizobium sp. TRM95796]MCV3764699.1 histidine kinase [Rhizobium sp. TRM95796]
MYFNTPLARFLGMLLLICSVCVAVFYEALRQPFTAIEIRVDAIDNRVLARIDGQDHVLLAFTNPAQPVDEPGGGEGLRVAAIDFVEEPDMLPSYAALNEFFDQQARIRRLLDLPEIGAVVVDGSNGDDSPRVVVTPVVEGRSFQTLPAAFWTQMAAGFLTCGIAAFFLALRPNYPPILAFATTGIGVAGAAFSAALYSTRHLAMEAPTFIGLSLVNQASTYLFGIATIYLFSIYPASVIAPKRLWPAPLLTLSAFIFYRLQWAPHDLVTTQVVILVMLVVIIALVAAQYRATRGDPAGRAVLLWLGLSVVFGAGAFAMFVALPAALGLDVIMTQSTGFIPLAAIYVGTALGIARFRLFDLGRWAYRILLYGLTLTLLFACDAALVMILRLSPSVSLAIAAAVTGIAYLPIRDLLLQRLFRSDTPDIATLYRQTVAVGLQPTATARASAWMAMLDDTFQPIHIEASASDEKPEAFGLRREGEQLVLQALADIPAMRLSFAGRGRRLFNRGDVALAGELSSLVETTIANRAAYERGALEERQRIARDLHDEVGASLLSGLHAATPERRHECIVDALSDVRQIASGLAGRDITLAGLIAQMRHESRTRIEAHGCDLSWPLDAAADESDIILPYHLHRNLYAIHREAISNALAHGARGTIGISSRLREGRLDHEITNPCEPRHDGGSDAGPATLRRMGSSNMRARADQIGGDLAIERRDACYILRLSFKVAKETA